MYRTKQVIVIMLAYNAEQALQKKPTMSFIAQGIVDLVVLRVCSAIS